MTSRGRRLICLRSLDEKLDREITALTKTRFIDTFGGGDARRTQTSCASTIVRWPHRIIKASDGVSKKKAAENREEILKAASRLIRERSISGAGVDAVTEASEIIHGSRYSQFGYKERLVEEALDSL